jgi:hypothetical protein
MPTKPSERQAYFLEAQSNGQGITYTPKNTHYVIVGIGISKDDNTNTWEESVSYSDGTQNYTRFTRDMHNFVAEEINEPSYLEKPAYLTVVFEVRSPDDFAPINKMLMKSLSDYDEDKASLWCVIASSNTDEIATLDAIADALEIDDMEEIRRLIDD